jgi:hypothetical protein
VSGSGKAEIILVALILLGLASLVASVFVPAQLSSPLTIAAVVIASCGVLAYLVEAWRSGAVATAAPFEESSRMYDEPPPGAKAPGDEHAAS